MTRKDYEMLAGVLRPQVDNARTIRLVESSNGVTENLVSQAMANVVSTIAYNLVQRLSDENERFDHLRFYDACGFRVTENYPVVFLDQQV